MSGSAGGSGVSTIISQDLAMLNLGHLLTLYEANAFSLSLYILILAKQSKESSFAHTCLHCQELVTNTTKLCFHRHHRVDWVDGSTYQGHVEAIVGVQDSVDRPNGVIAHKVDQVASPSTASEEPSDTVSPWTEQRNS